jgi:hypothetical protein
MTKHSLAMWMPMEEAMPDGWNLAVGADSLRDALDTAMDNPESVIRAARSEKPT